MTDEEYDSLRFQIGTSKEESTGKGGRRYLPYVFTEQGISMLAAVLHSETAINVSIGIMRAFVAMRKFLNNHALMFEKISEIEVKQREYQKSIDARFDKIYDYIAEHEEARQTVFFEGQIYDAFSLLTSLVEKANKNIILVDNYVDIGTLNVLSKKKENVDVCIYTVKNTKLNKEDVEKFNKQYSELRIKFTGVFHDRFLILDDMTAYHIGASIKDAGRKCFGISLIEDKRIVRDILERLELEAENDYNKNSKIPLDPHGTL